MDFIILRNRFLPSGCFLPLDRQDVQEQIREKQRQARISSSVSAEEN